MLALSTLGDAITNLIASSADPIDPKVRLSSVLSIGKIVARDAMDKRAIPAIVTRLSDGGLGIRIAALSVLGISGWLDGTVNACVRNHAYATVVALSKKDPDMANRAHAAALAEHLAELGIPDPRFTFEMCQNPDIFDNPDELQHERPPTPPAAPGAWTTTEKVAVGGAVAAVLGVGLFTALGR